MTALFLRLLIALCLMLALAGLEVTNAAQPDRLSVVFLLDVSDSMPLAAFDFKVDREIHPDPVIASDDHILIFEGVFLFRPELLHYWDFKIFVDIDFQTSLNRALERDLYLFGEREEIIQKYQERYIPGQKIYLGFVEPKTKANIVIEKKMTLAIP